MIKVAIVDLTDECNAPVSITVDAFQIAESLAEQPLAEVEKLSGKRLPASRKKLGTSPAGSHWDVVVVPGLGLSNSRAPWAALETRHGTRLVEFLKCQYEQGAWLAASCTGTFALAEAGLLEGRSATTSWWLAAEFRQRYPGVLLRPGALTTEDGRLLCAGGSLAQVDLMLILIAKRFGVALSTRVAQYLVSPWRGPQSAVAEVSQTRITDPLVVAAVQHVRAKLGTDLSVEDVASAVATSTRTLHRRIQATLGISAVGLMRRIKGEEALRLLRETDLPLGRIADQVGYRNEAPLRALMIELSGETPAALRRRYRGRA